MVQEALFVGLLDQKTLQNGRIHEDFLEANDVKVTHVILNEVLHTLDLEVIPTTCRDAYWPQKEV